MRGVLIALRAPHTAASARSSAAFPALLSSYVCVEFKTSLPPHAAPTWSVHPAQSAAKSRSMRRDGGSGSSDLPPPVGISTGVYR
jgi:hypothetical protein